MVRPNQIAQSFIQLGKHLRMQTLEKKIMKTHQLSLGNLLQCLTILTVKKILLISSRVGTPITVYDYSFQLISVVSCPLVFHCCEETGSAFLMTFSLVLRECCSVPPKPPLFQPSKSLSLFSSHVAIPQAVFKKELYHMAQKMVSHVAEIAKGKKQFAWTAWILCFLLNIVC